MQNKIKNIIQERHLIQHYVVILKYQTCLPSDEPAHRKQSSTLLYLFLKELSLNQMFQGVTKHFNELKFKHKVREVKKQLT